MSNHPLRIAVLALAAAVAAGCASNDTRYEASEPAPAAERATVVNTESTHVDRSTTTIVTPANDELVGVPACDDFLASYKACHMVIGTYAPDILDKRYMELRNTFVSQSHDPAVSGTLEARCNGLIAQRDEALAGRACLPSADAPIATTDDDLMEDGE